MGKYNVSVAKLAIAILILALAFFVMIIGPDNGQNSWLPVRIPLSSYTGVYCVSGVLALIAIYLGIDSFEKKNQRSKIHPTVSAMAEQDGYDNTKDYRTAINEGRHTTRYRSRRR